MNFEIKVMRRNDENRNFFIQVIEKWSFGMSSSNYDTLKEAQKYIEEIEGEEK